MIKLQVQSFHLPRWMVPAMILIALALIPFALVLGLALTTVAVVISVLRLVSHPSGQPPPPRFHVADSQLREAHSDSTVIDADYEIKDDNGKK